jgi:hypothetical protein
MDRGNLMIAHWCSKVGHARLWRQFTRPWPRNVPAGLTLTILAVLMGWFFVSLIPDERPYYERDAED